MVELERSSKRTDLYNVRYNFRDTDATAIQELYLNRKASILAAAAGKMSAILRSITRPGERARAASFPFPVAS